MTRPTRDLEFGEVDHENGFVSETRQVQDGFARVQTATFDFYQFLFEEKDFVLDV